MLFNLLAVCCCWALFTVSTSYALLFACCSKKKPRPKRGGISQLRTNLNQLPTPESAKQPKGVKSLKSPQSSKQQLAGAKSGTQGKKAPPSPNTQLAVGGQKKKMKPPESPPNKPTPAIIVPSSTTNFGPSPHGVDVPPTIEPLDDSEIFDEEKEIHKVDEETQTILRGEQVQSMVALIKSQKQEIASRKPSTTSVDAAQQTSTKVKASMDRHPHHHRGRHSRQSHAIELIKMVDKEQQTSDRLIGSKAKKSQRSTTAAEEERREPPPPPPAAAGTRSRIVETGTGSRVEASNRSERAATAAPVSEAEEEPKATEEKGLETVRIFTKEDVPKKSAKESSKSSEEESSSRSSSGSSGPTQSRRPPTPPPRKEHRRRRR